MINYLKQQLTINALQKVMRVGRIKACSPVQFAPLSVCKEALRI